MAIAQACEGDHRARDWLTKILVEGPQAGDASPGKLLKGLRPVALEQVRQVVRLGRDKPDPKPVGGND